MLPSLLARDIQEDLKQFLVSGFEQADAFMHGLCASGPAVRNGFCRAQVFPELRH